MINIIEFMSNFVDGLLKDETHLGRRNLLLKVKALVHGTAIPDFVDDFNRGSHSFFCFSKDYKIRSMTTQSHGPKSSDFFGA